MRSGMWLELDGVRGFGSERGIPDRSGAQAWCERSTAGEQRRRVRLPELLPAKRLRGSGALAG